jgi:hypothetical protein
MACETCGFAQRWPRPKIWTPQGGWPCPDDYHYDVEKRARRIRWATIATALAVVTVYVTTLVVVVILVPPAVIYGVLTVGWAGIIWHERHRPWRPLLRGRLPAFAVFAVMLFEFIVNL